MLKDRSSILEHPKIHLSQGWIWSAVPWLVSLGIIIDSTRLIWHNDVFLHIRMGLYTISTGKFSGDPNWTYGPAELEYTSPLAGSQALMAFVYSTFNWAGVAALAGILAGLAGGTLWWALASLAPPRETTTSPVPARVAVLVFLLITGFLLSYGLDPRPQLFSLLFFPLVGVWAIRIVVFGVFPRWWQVFLLTLLWSWLHGYALLVAPILALATVAHLFGAPPRQWGHRIKLLFAPATLSILPAFLATLLTPLGLSVYTNSINIRSVSTGLISEWSPPSWDTPFPWYALTFAMLWLSSALYSYYSDKKCGTQIGGTLLGEAIFAFGVVAIFITTQRTLPILYILLGLLAARRLMLIIKKTPPLSWEKTDFAKRYTILGKTTVVAAALVFSGLWVIQHPGNSGLDSSRIPLKIFATLQEESQKEPRYIIPTWDISSPTGMLVPAARIAVDGRLDRYGPSGVYDLQIKLFNLEPDWVSILSQYPETTDMILTGEEPLVGELLKQNWTIRGEDPSGYVWISRTPRS